jgi:hypothetical protein
VRQTDDVGGVRRGQAPHVLRFSASAAYAIAQMSEGPSTEGGRGGSGAPEAGEPGLTHIESFEREIASLPEVRAVRVVATHAGRITEIHLIAEGRKSPKHLVRDVQTLSQANFGIEIDHRIVSVVQFSGDVPLTPELVPRLSALSWSTEGGRATCRVRLEAGEETTLGESSGPATSVGRGRLTAQATTQALSTFGGGRPTADVADVTFLDIGAHRVAITVLVLATPDGDETVVAGSAIVRGDDHEAVVRAILDAFARG